MRIGFDSYGEVVSALSRNKRRSLLTGFGVFWGIFMLLALVGGGAGLRVMLNKEFEGFATNSTFLFSNTTTKPFKGFKEGRYWNLDETDIERLRAMVPEIEVISGVMSRWGQTAECGTNTVTCSVKGVSSNYNRIEEPLLKYGRFLNESDCLHKRKVCVIGKRIYTSLFPEGGDPCGRMIKVGPVWYRVVGVNFASGNVNINGRPDEAVLVPVQLAQQIYHSGKVYHLIGMVGRDGVKVSTLENRIRSVVARQHSFDPTDKHALFVMNTEQMFSLMDNLFRGLDVLIWLVGLGTILAGVIGVSNIMMVTVRERTVEIGIRRAIGATPAGILSQIISESITLTLVAGGAGIVFSVLVLGAVESGTGESAFSISFWTAFGAASLLVALGVAAGLPPAMRAMKIKPVDAMRDE